jgi:hypothetical protein
MDTSFDATNLDVDSVWNNLGRFGSYQLRQELLLLINVLPCAYPVLSLVFMGKNCISPITMNEITVDQRSSMYVPNQSLVSSL